MKQLGVKFPPIWNIVLVVKTFVRRQEAGGRRQEEEGGRKEEGKESLFMYGLIIKCTNFAHPPMTVAYYICCK